jgi:uncharacterized protein (DUF58 family)
MRPWQLIIVIAIDGVAALTSGWHPLYIIFYVLLASLIFSVALASWGSRGLAFARTLPGGRAQMGEVIEERLRLENRSWFPKLWVQVTDNSTLPNHHAGYVASIGGHKRIDWRVRTTCTRRGRYFIGPVTATTGDPLGLYTRTIPLSGQRELLVLPRILPITRFEMTSGMMPGRGRGSQRSLQVTTNAVTVREHRPGDALSRIHWPSSARLSKLMVKEFDLDPTIDAWIVLDLDEAVQAGSGSESTEEYGVTIAATLANYFLNDDLSVGVIINDGHETILGLDRGQRQLDRALEALAVTYADATPPLSEALTLHEMHFMRNSIVIVITPSSEDDWAVELRQLGRRGVRTFVIALDGESFGGDHPDIDIHGLLANIGIPALSVHRGTDLVHMLEVGTEH